MSVILIHIPKTGGNAIRRCQRLQLELFGMDKMVSASYVTKMKAAMTRYGLSPQHEHCRWRDLDVKFREAHPAVAVVRNPWSKLVSQFLFAKKILREDPKKTATPVKVDTSFDEFLSLRHRWGREPYFWHRTTIGFYPQVDHVTDEDGKLRCDILRFEHHTEDTMRYFGLDKPIAPRNVSNVEKKDYREFYTPETIQAVGDWYERDIITFGFDFDTAATKEIWAA